MKYLSIPNYTQVKYLASGLSIAKFTPSPGFPLTCTQGLPKHGLIYIQEMQNHFKINLMRR